MRKGPTGFLAVFGVALLLGICFGFGFAAGRGSSNGETVEEKRGGLPRMPGLEASELDPDVGDVFQRLEGATNEDFIAELERRLDGDFPERRDARMAFLIRWPTVVDTAWN